MIITDHRTRNRHELDTGEHPGTHPDTTTPHPDPGLEPDAGTDAGTDADADAGTDACGVAVLIPVTGLIRTIAWEPNVVALAQREIGAATVERLSLGRSLVAGGLQIWLDEDGLLTGRQPNPRASALLIAAFAQHRERVPVPRPMLVGDALLCTGHPGGGLCLGLSDTDAAAVTRAATNLTRRLTIHQEIHPDSTTHHAAHRATRRRPR
jgi:hypothetical protein